MDEVGHARQPGSVAMTAHPLRHLSAALAISLAIAVALESAKGGYAAPVPTAEAEVNHGSDQPDRQAMARHADQLRAEGKYAAAADIWRELLDFYEKSLGSHDPVIAIILNKLAPNLWDQGERQAAELLYRRSLAIRENDLGPDHPHVAVTLNNLALVLSEQGRYSEAEHLYRRSLIILQKVLGADHPDIATNLNNLAGLLSIQGKHGEAESFARRSLGIREKALGHDHPDITKSLDNLGEILWKQGQFIESERLVRRALAIREKTLGQDHPDVATSFNNLATLLKDQGQYSKAEPYYHQSLNINEKALGPDHPNVATNLDNLASLLSSRGQYRKAEALYRRSLAIREKVLGPGHPEVATSLNNLGVLLKEQGRYEAAELLYRRSLNIYEKSFGLYHPRTALAYDNLAVLLGEQGQYKKAGSLHRLSLDIREKVLGPDHSDVATSLNNLAILLVGQGQYAAAEPLFRRSAAIDEKLFGKDHPQYATSVDNLADLLGRQGRHRDAELLSRRSLAIREKALGPNHPDVAVSLNNLAILLSKQGQHKEAESLHNRSLTIREKTLGRNHPSVALSLNNLAGSLRNQGQLSAAALLYRRSLAINEEALEPDSRGVAAVYNNLALLSAEEGYYSKAESLFRRSLGVLQKVLGPDHVDIAHNLSNLAIMLSEQGKLGDSTTNLSRSIEIETAWLKRELPLLSNRARLAQLYQLGGAWEATVGFIDRYPPAAQLALETRLNRQGLLAEIEQRQVLLLNAPGIDRDKVEQLQALTQQLASVSLPPDRRAAVRDQRDRLQAELYRQNPDLQIETVTPAAVAKALPADGVLVEFQRYRPFDGRKPKDERWGKPQYIALVLKPNGSISAVPLGPAAAIDATVHKGLGSSADGLADADGIWGQLSQQVLQPLLPHLSGSRQWFLSPDGELNRVPFAALPAPQQPTMPLAQAVQLRLVTTGRELVRLQQPAPSGSSAVVMANPSYDRPGRKTVTAARPDAVSIASQRRSGDLGSSRWLPLPATEQEGKHVATLLGTRLVGGPAATTTALQRQQGPRVLHVATHGFFIADQEAPPTDPLRMVQEQAPQLKALRGEDPQLRSGLVMAGANQPDLDPNDDGYLTAAEAVSLDLNGTELVVLSACSTGQGEVRTGEGVYGLQRSLTVAGARSTLLSLWKVDDAATAEFMVRFYKRLKAGEGRADALAAVQAEFRSGSVRGPKGEDWSTPYHWAAWQLVGDWRQIQGL